MNNIVFIGKRLIYIALFSLILMSNGCNIITNAVNEKWPSLNTLDQQKAAANKVYATLSNARLLNAALQVDSKTFKLLIDEAFKRNKLKLSRLSVEGIRDIAISNADFSLVDQAVEVGIDFEFIISKYDLKLKGFLSGLAGISSNAKNIEIHPALSHVRLNNIDGKKEKSIISDMGTEGAIRFVNLIINRFLDNINGAFISEPLLIPIDIVFAKNISPSDLIKADGFTVTSENNISFQTDSTNFITYITEKGIIIFAADARIEGTTEKIGSDTNILKNLTSLMHRKIEESGFDLHNGKTSFSVRKGFVAKIFNEGLENIDVKLHKKNFVEISEKDQFFSEEVRFHDRQRLPSCSGLRRSFKNYSCDRNCRQGSCDGPCKMKDCPSCSSKKVFTNILKGNFNWVKDCSKRAACEAENAVRKTGCALCKTAKVAEKAACDAKEAACKTKREAERVALKAENEIRVGKCNTNRLALKFVDGFTEVAELSGQFKITSSDLNVRVSKLNVSEDLSMLSVVTALSASANTWLRVNVNPEGLGHIACIWKFRKTLENTVSASFHGRPIKITLSVEKDQNGGLFLTGATQKEIIDMDLKPIPYLQLVNDPGFVLNCTLMTMAMPAIAGVQLLRDKDIPKPLKAIFGDYEIEIDSKSFRLPLRPVTIGDDEGFNLTLNHNWTASYIGFDVEKAN